MEKRGLSDVVTTVLIILLVLAAVVIVWAFVRPAITKAGGSIDTQQFSGVLSVVPKSVVISDTIAPINGEQNDTISFSVKRGSGEGEVAGAFIILTDSTGKSYTGNITNDFDEFESILYTKKYTDANLIDVVKIEVYPMLRKKDGKIEPGTIKTETPVSRGGGGSPPPVVPPVIIPPATPSPILYLASAEIREIEPGTKGILKLRIGNNRSEQTTVINVYSTNKSCNILGTTAISAMGEADIYADCTGTSVGEIYDESLSIEYENSTTPPSDVINFTIDDFNVQPGITFDSFEINQISSSGEGPVKFKTTNSLDRDIQVTGVYFSNVDSGQSCDALPLSSSPITITSGGGNTDFYVRCYGSLYSGNSFNGQVVVDFDLGGLSYSSSFSLSGSISGTDYFTTNSGVSDSSDSYWIDVYSYYPNNLDITYTSVNFWSGASCSDPGSYTGGLLSGGSFNLNSGCWSMDSPSSSYDGEVEVDFRIPEDSYNTYVEYVGFSGTIDW